TTSRRSARILAPPLRLPCAGPSWHPKTVPAASSSAVAEKNLAQEILCKRLIPDEEEANGRRRSDASRREPASLVSDSGDLFNQARPRRSFSNWRQKGGTRGRPPPLAPE